MSCPNCGSDNTWDDNLHWGCSDCKWCSLAGLNPTRTPSAPYSMTPDPSEVRRRARDWALRDEEERMARWNREERERQERRERGED